jgi:hypothetical protein
MAAIDLEVHMVREGLLLKLQSPQGTLFSTINLQEYLKLTDEQAAELLAKLDAQGKEENEC